MHVHANMHEAQKHFTKAYEFMSVRRVREMVEIRTGDGSGLTRVLGQCFMACVANEQ